MNHMKSFAAISLAALFAYFEPVHSVLVGLAWLFVLNFLFGLATGIIAQGESFQFRKAFRCLSEASVFLLLLASVFFIGDHLGARGQSLQAVSTIAYALTYFYAVNICKNLMQLFPRSKCIAFLYYLVSVEILAKLPRIKEYLKPKGHDADSD